MTATDLERAQAGFATCGMLAEAILRGLRLTPPWEVVDVVVQDEYTHDIVMAAGGRAGPAGPAIVLDCT